MTGVAAYVVLVVVLPALGLGRQGQDFPPLAWWRAWRTTGPRRGVVAPLAAEHVTRAPESTPSLKRRPTPSWAHTQPLDTEEAA